MASIVSACAAIILIAHCVGHGPVYLDLLRDCPFLLCFFLNILFCVSFSMPSKRTRLWIAILCLLVWKNCLFVLGLLIRAIEYSHLGHTYVFVTLWAL